MSVADRPRAANVNRRRTLRHHDARGERAHVLPAFSSRLDDLNKDLVSSDQIAEAGLVGGADVLAGIEIGRRHVSNQPVVAFEEAAGRSLRRAVDHVGLGRRGAPGLTDRQSRSTRVSSDNARALRLESEGRRRIREHDLRDQETHRVDLHEQLMTGRGERLTQTVGQFNQGCQGPPRGTLGLGNTTPRSRHVSKQATCIALRRCVGIDGNRSSAPVLAEAISAVSNASKRARLRDIKEFHTAGSVPSAGADGKKNCCVNARTTPVARFLLPCSNYRAMILA